MERIYTTYFDNIHNLPSEIVPISIARKPPKWWDGLEYKKLAPKEDFFLTWRENRDNNYYTQQFFEKVIGGLEANVVVAELQGLVPCSRKIALVCYEEPKEFCHRHLVAWWLRQCGFEVDEYVY